ncbi:flagellar filament capping protein FliD [Paenibacillus chitinolyticus]|uniref:flagellar filament capping protein FliD n=1 Tax=Paenibacillus chitinolyticus TaxID=79263 RepID=UPI003669FE20
MAGITPTRLTGFSGTLDTDSIIKNLMKAESVPLNNIQKKKQFMLWEREDYQTMNSTLLSFRNTINTLRFESNFEKITAVSSNPSVLKVNSSGSNIGDSNIEVTQLGLSATIVGSKVTTKSTDPVGIDGSFTVENSAGKSATITVKSDSTIDSIVKDINSNATTTGVKASFDQNSGVLYLTTTSAGSQSSIKITGTTFNNVFGATTPTTATGQDAKYKVNGTEVTSSSNNVTINGTQVTLTGVGNASIGTTKDRSSSIEAIKKFVEQYNSLIDKYSAAYTTKVNRDYKPLTSDEKEAMTESQVTKWEEKARQGTLYNDAILKDTLYKMRAALNTPLNVPKGQIDTLSDIGITVSSNYKENGKLQINETKLAEAINTNFDQVKQLFTFVPPTGAPDVAGKSNKGIADALYEKAGIQMEAIKKKIGSGSIDALDDSIMGKQLKDLRQQESNWTSKLKDIETRYYKKFSAMESALEKLKSQQSSIASMLG